MKKIIFSVIISFLIINTSYALPGGKTPGTKKSGTSVIEPIQSRAFKPARYTVATLPTLSAGDEGAIVQVTDGDGATDCTTGSGSDTVMCRWTGSAWANAGDGTAAGSAEVQDEVFSSANFDADTTHGVSQDDFYDLWHGVDADDDGSFTDEAWLTAYLTPAEFTSTIGAAYDTSAELDALFSAKQDSLTFGIADTNALQVDATAGTPNDDEMARFTASGMEGLTYAELAAVTESANEGVMDLQDMQGAVTDGQVPNNITIDLSTLATTLTISDNEATAENNAVLFTSGGDLDGGNLGIESDGDFYYNPSTGTASATHFSGEIEGSDLDIANMTTETSIATNDLVIIYDVTAGANRAMTKGNFVSGIGAGQAVVFDIGDDGGDDSTDLGEIATTGDTNSIITLNAADKMLIDMGQDWPKADLADSITIVDNEATAENNAILFTPGGDLDGGNLTPETDGDLYYNPSTGTLHATILDLGVAANVTETELEIIDGATLNTNDLNVIDGLADSGSMTVAELMILDGATLSTTDLNIIDGISDTGSLTAAELLYVDGVTSAIQTQLDARCLESVFGTSLNADDLELNVGALQLAAEIPHTDVSETITGNWTFSGTIAANGEVTLGADLNLNANEIQSISDIAFQLGDNAGTYSFDIQDSDGTVVFSVDSDGAFAQSAVNNPYISLLENDGTSYYIGVYDTTVDRLEFRRSATVNTSVDAYLDTAGLFVAGNMNIESGAAYQINGTQINIGNLGTGGNWTPTGSINLDSSTLTLNSDKLTVDNGSNYTTFSGNAADDTIDELMLAIDTWASGVSSGTFSALTDTNIATPSSGQIAIYDGTDSWDNKSVSGEISLAADGTVALSNTGIVLTSLTVGSLIGIDSIDATGAVDMDYGSADITDHTFVSDGGTTIIDGSIIIPDTGNIGSTTDTDSIAIAANGEVTFSQEIQASAGIDASAGTAVLGTFSGTLTDGTASWNGSTQALSGFASLAATAITENGQAIYNASETPGGELGGTWANPTIDDTGITLTSITIGALLGVDSIDATGAVDMDYGSADVTDHTFIADGGTAIIDGSFQFPDADGSPSVAGELQYDNTIAGIDDGGLVWYDDDDVQILVSISATDFGTGPTDDYVLAYDAVNDKWYAKEDSTGSGSLGTNLTSTTNDITTDNSVIQLIGNSEDLDIEFQANQVDISSDTGVDVIAFTGLDIVVGGSDLSLGSAGVKLTGDGDGAITFLGLGDGSDENLIMNLDDTANHVVFSSGTGVTDIDFTAMNINTTGVIKGRASYGADISGAVSHDTTATHGVFYHFTAAATVTLDAAADAGYGAQVCYRVRDAAEAAVIDVQAAEKINLAGTALAAGTAITATGAGESVCMVATTDTDGSGTDGWEAWGPTSGWASE